MPEAVVPSRFGGSRTFNCCAGVIVPLIVQNSFDKGTSTIGPPQDTAA